MNNRMKKQIIVEPNQEKIGKILNGNI